MLTERLSDEEAAKIIARPPTCSGILKDGTPAANMFQDWQRARASESAKEAENAALREEVERLRGEVERERGYKGDLGNDFQRVCGWLKTAIDALDYAGREGTATELRLWLESMSRERIERALSESKDGGR